MGVLTYFFSGAQPGERMRRAGERSRPILGKQAQKSHGVYWIPCRPPSSQIADGEWTKAQPERGRGQTLLDALGHGLRLEAELGGKEGVFLGHGILGAVEAVEDELAEKRVTDFAVAT